MFPPPYRANGAKIERSDLRQISYLENFTKSMFRKPKFGEDNQNTGTLHEDLSMLTLLTVVRNIL